MCVLVHCIDQIDATDRAIIFFVLQTDLNKSVGLARWPPFPPKQAFAAPGTPAATTATMESIDKLRDELIEEVSRAKVNQPGVATAVNRYAPQLHRIIQSIDASVSRLADRLTALAFLVLPIEE